ncbi:MAG: trigger factor [Armatimonadetes bacterium]|nr:trigger factor [Armatimonadota bacterium]
MKVTVSEKSPVERIMEVIVDSTRLEGAYEQAFDRVRRKLALPGFRKGKVPAQLARKYITDDGLISDVLEAVVPGAYREALQKENLFPISEPQWEFVQKERGKDLIFKVTFEVKPEVELEAYRGTEIVQEKPVIEEEDVVRVLEDMRGSQARLTELKEDRGLEENDIALVDYTSQSGGENTGSATNYLLELKKENYIEGFVEKLYGLKAGEERSFNVQFPEEWENKDLAGKDVTFDFKLHEIKVRELPELDDEFAKAASEKETLEELRSDIRERLEKNVEGQARRAAAGKIMKKLLEQVPSERVPRSLHSYRTNVELRKAANELARHGLELEQYLQRRNVSKEQWAMELQAAGMVEARVELIVDAVSRAEGIRLDQEEVNRILGAEARARRISEKKLQAQMEEDGSIELLKYNVLRAQVQEFLVDQADVKYVPPGQAQEAAAEAKPAEPEKKKAKASKKKASKAEDAEEQPRSPEEEAEPAAKPRKKPAAKKKEKDAK